MANVSEEMYKFINRSQNILDIKHALIINFSTYHRFDNDYLT